MPPKHNRGERRHQNPNAAHPIDVPDKSINLLASEEEKLHTSQSLYNDHKARVSAHVHLLSDRVKMPKLKASLTKNFKGQSLLHVGCGMGLLAMQAAKSISSKVVAIDTSSIVDAARQAAQDNKLTNLSFRRGKASEVLTSDDKFDVIVGDWHSAFLTNDRALIDEMLYVRDHHLAPGGSIMPNKATLYVCAITDFHYLQETLNYWDNVYGFRMPCMKSLVTQEASTGAIPQSCISTNVVPVHTVEMATLSSDKLGYDVTPFTLTASRKCTLHFVTVFVDCAFVNSAGNVDFSIPDHPTGPNTLCEVSLTLPEPLPVNRGDTVHCKLSVAPGQGASGSTAVTLEVTYANADLNFNHSSTSKFNFAY